MNILFNVDITVDIPDAAVAKALEIPLEQLAGEVANGGLNHLAIGQFGDLQLVKGTEDTDMTGKVTSYTTGEFVEEA